MEITKDAIDAIINYYNHSVENGNITSNLFWGGLKNREIWIDCDISEDTLVVDKLIHMWNREDSGVPKKERKPIVIHIFSCGGDLDVCNSIISTISASRTPVYGINEGRCLSAAAYIFISCHKRYMLDSSYFLFHQGSSELAGSFDKLDAQMEDYKKQVSELASIMKKYTNYSDEDIDKNIKTEWFVHSDEAVKNKVCDKIIKSLDEVIY